MKQVVTSWLRSVQAGNTSVSAHSKLGLQACITLSSLSQVFSLISSFHPLIFMFPHNLLRENEIIFFCRCLIVWVWIIVATVIKTKIIFVCIMWSLGFHPQYCRKANYFILLTNFQSSEVVFYCSLKMTSEKIWLIGCLIIRFIRNCGRFAYLISFNRHTHRWGESERTDTYAKCIFKCPRKLEECPIFQS